MPECRYCDTAFETDDVYHTHLETEHFHELGPIDRRRIGAEKANEQTRRPNALVAIGLVVAIALTVVGVFLFVSADSSSNDVSAQQQPSGFGSVHSHGTMEMVVDGQRVDFSREQYQLRADAFHFEGGDGIQWHVHARGVTLEYAMATLGIDVSETSVTYRETTYGNPDSGTTATVTVNGASVTPSEYVLQRGDRIRIILARDSRAYVAVSP